MVKIASYRTSPELAIQSRWNQFLALVQWQYYADSYQQLDFKRKTSNVSTPSQVSKLSANPPNVAALRRANFWAQAWLQRAKCATSSCFGAPPVVTLQDEGCGFLLLMMGLLVPALYCKLPWETNEAQTTLGDQRGSNYLGRPMRPDLTYELPSRFNEPAV